VGEVPAPITSYARSRGDSHSQRTKVSARECLETEYPLKARQLQVDCLSVSREPTIHSGSYALDTCTSVKRTGPQLQRDCPVTQETHGTMP
jgi:hypothetical protein